MAERHLELKAWGWTPSWAEAWSSLDEPSLEVGRVTSRDRNRWVVQTTAGAGEARVLSIVEKEGLPAVGDWVTLHPGPGVTDPWSIEGILPRRSKFSRQAAGHRSEEQVIAANVDRVWIVHGLDVLPNPRRLERYLALSWESGAQPEIILSKADVAIDLAESRRIVTELAVGVPIWVVSITEEPGLDGLARSLDAGTTVALLGASGVGKSSLINRLAGAQLLETAEVRDRDKKGRHTTVRRQLIQVEGGALLLDNPGMRELQIWELDEGLPQAFPEIDELGLQCRFRDCSHGSEPGCAVLAAAAAGSLDQGRLDSYRKLQAESEYQRRKSDPLAQAAAVSEFKSAMKSLKQHHPKYRERK